MYTDDFQSPAVAKPAVVTWFKVYAGVLFLVYLAVIAFSFIFLLVDPEDLEMPAAEAKVMGIMFLAVGSFLSIACLIPLLARPRPWVWVYSLVIICLGMTSACFLPACIPLIIFWIKPETKRYHGMKA